MSFACCAEGAWQCHPREAELSALDLKGLKMLYVQLESGDEALDMTWSSGALSCFPFVQTRHIQPP